MKLTFKEEQIQALFGHEAAEDELPSRLRQYYIKSSTYDQVVTSLPLRILVGHKGIGKSALFQIAMAEDREVGRLTLVVQPDDVIEIGQETGDFLRTIRNWKSGLIDLLAAKAMAGLGTASQGWKDRFKSHGGRLVEFLLATLQSPVDYISLDPAKKLIVDQFLHNSEISVYIVDLDRGWQGRQEDITRISALLNAVRDIARDNDGIHFRISLRSDVYFLVRTSDESTDKTEGSVVWQSWEQHEIFALLVKRINTFLGGDRPTHDLISYSQKSLAQYLEPVFEPRFSGAGHWSDAPTQRVLMSLTRKRPRDLVKLCSLAARNARTTGSSIIRTNNLKNVFVEYSQGRIQDTINEYRSELPEVERLLFGMKPSKKERTTKEGYVYTTDALFNKLRAIQEQGKFRFANGKPAYDQDLAAFLYKINFLTARKERADLIDRKYFEESRYLQSSFADFGYDWEIHPAYRWALQPDDLESIFANLRLSADD